MPCSNQHAAVTKNRSYGKIAGKKKEKTPQKTNQIEGEKKRGSQQALVSFGK
jgi:hypothetical protein